MRFKADENIPHRVVAFLVERGHDVRTVAGEELIGASDARLFMHAICDRASCSC